MLTLKLENDEEKVKKQIMALEWELKQDLPEKDRNIFEESLQALKEHLKKLERMKKIGFEKQEVYVLTAWLRDCDDEGNPMNWSGPSEEYYAYTYDEALKLKDELLLDEDIEDVWISDDKEIKELLICRED